MRSSDRHEKLGITDHLVFMQRCCWQGCLHDLGDFPGAVPGKGTVRGELFRLTDPHVWAVLDQYEGYEPNRAGASLFVRRRTRLQVPNGQTAWVYWYNGDPSGHDRIPSGDWAAYVRSKGSA